MSGDIKAKVRSQFGAASEAYAVSDVHAKGESLALLLRLVRPQQSWLALDVATGAGHTALAFAPHVARVIATDLTAEMLAETAELARARGLSNLETRFADAEALPFADGTFDLVTCRLAFHHFLNSRQAVAEFVRVLRPGGVLGFADNITVRDRQAAEYYNAFEKLRDPSHHWVLSQAELQALFEEAGLTVEQIGPRLTKVFEFHEWADRQHVSPANKQKLLEMLRHVPEALQPLLAPRFAAGTAYFSLWEAVIVARKIK